MIPRKLKPLKYINSISDIFVKRKQKARRKIQTKCSQKVSKGKEKAILKVEVHRSPVHVGDEERRTEKTGTKRMTRESSVKQGLVFAEHRDKLLCLFLSQ